MPISKSSQLFNLVKSLTSAEKRNFRLYAKRIQDSDDLLFLKLFDLLDRQKNFNESEAIKGMNGIDKSKFSNLKRHLYSQIIASLRIVFKEKRSNFKVREYIDYAYILYGKGLYRQALKILQKAMKLAKENHFTYLQLIIVEFEKKIETRHITRSGSNRALQLIKASELIQQDADYLVRLSNLRINMHAKYLEYGHISSKKEAKEIKSFYDKKIKTIDLTNLGVMEHLHYIQSRVWYYYILLDFAACHQYSKEWVKLLDENRSLIDRDVDLYLRGYHYVLTTARHLKDKKAHSEYLKTFERFRKTNYGKFNPNSQILSFLYVHTGRLDHIILTGEVERVDYIIGKSLNRIRRYSYKVDHHRIMVFYYKFAWIYLSVSKPSKAINYLNKIINNEVNKLREDLQNYARILQLFCQYDLGNFDILQYLLNTHANYFSRKKNINEFLTHCMEMFDSVKSKGAFDHKIVFQKYHTLFSSFFKDPYERRVLDYLDILSWLESKIKSVSLAEVVRRK